MVEQNGKAVWFQTCHLTHDKVTGIVGTGVFPLKSCKSWSVHIFKRANASAVTAGKYAANMTNLCLYTMVDTVQNTTRKCFK